MNLKYLYSLVMVTGLCVCESNNTFALNLTEEVPGANPSFNRQQLTATAFLNQADLIAMKGTLNAGVAAEMAINIQLKNYARQITDAQYKINEVLLALAKSKGVVLPMSKPEGGQRPDGRVDAAPLNLQDSSRNQNANGQAGDKYTGNGALQGKDIQQSVTRLKKLKGKAFDQTYADEAIADHKKAINLYERAQQSSDAAIKAHATKYLPLIKHSLARIEKLRQEI